jgi:hypothetical protein
MTLLSLRNRLDRLEQRQSRSGVDPLPFWFWSALSGSAIPDDADEADVARVEAIAEEAEAEHARAMEKHPVGLFYRQELARLGLPQPATLTGIDLIEECIRLAGIPTPDASRNGHLPVFGPQEDDA